ncbi:MAG: aminoacetone oxidase family FAD-binding enzyme [Alphaproteobacteria bacterium]|nr:aminoacetone oxidase family FAD-binding enzyme [Alphaproteobacteria bacterium]
MPAFDCFVIGGGAAGLFCALTAGRRGRRVVVLEHNPDVGAKILISGGGRCNFTNVEAGKAERYICDNPHFARSALARTTPADFVALVEKHKIAWYEKTLGQLFCEGAGSARKIVRMLMEECAAGGVEVRTGVRVSAATKADGFRVETSEGAFSAPALVIATGGLSIPKMGATDFAHRIAAQFGVGVVSPRPGLVPLTFGTADLAWMKPLAGVSAAVIARCGKAEFAEAALFTHRGLSGPAILRASSYWRPGAALTIDLLPDAAEAALVAAKRARPKALVKTALGALVPARLAEALAPGGVLGDLRDQALVDIVRRLRALAIAPTGTEGYAKAEVTAGGVDTGALSQKTMEAKAVPGLFFIGEAVDVTGWLGGYNFQWAWASGWAAGQAV